MYPSIHLSSHPSIHQFDTYNDTASCKAGLYDQPSFQTKHPDSLVSAAQHCKPQKAELYEFQTQHGL